MSALTERIDAAERQARVAAYLASLTPGPAHHHLLLVQHGVFTPLPREWERLAEEPEPAPTSPDWPALWRAMEEQMSEAAIREALVVGLWATGWELLAQHGDLFATPNAEAILLRETRRVCPAATPETASRQLGERLWVLLRAANRAAAARRGCSLAEFLARTGWPRQWWPKEIHDGVD